MDCGPAPLFEVQLELREPNIELVPHLIPADDPDGFQKIVSGLIDDIIHMASLIPRIASVTGPGSYEVSVLQAVHCTLA